jgi:hypothetical protein
MRMGCVTHMYEKETNLMFRMEMKCTKHAVENIRVWDQLTDLGIGGRMIDGFWSSNWVEFPQNKFQGRASVMYFVIRSNSLIQTTFSHPVLFHAFPTDLSIYLSIYI